MAKTYIGDGCYVDFNYAGQIVLTTEDGISTTNTIYLEPEVWRALKEAVAVARAKSVKKARGGNKSNAKTTDGK